MSLAEQLQQKLAAHCVVCPPSATLSLDVAIESLARVTTQPHVVFYQCNDNSERDCIAIEQLRSLTNCEIAAVTGSHEPRILLQFIRAGATDCLHDSDRFSDDLATLVARVGQNVDAGQRGRVVSVVSVSGGCGSSMLAVNLAAAWANEQLRCALVELAFNGGDNAAMLDIHPQHTVADLCLPAVELDAEMLEKSMAEHPCGIRLLAGQQPWKQQHPLTPQTCSHIVRLAAGLFPYVVLDLQDVFHHEQFAATQESDLLLIVLRLELPCLIRMRQVLGYLADQGFPVDRVRLVVNRHVQKSRIKPAQVIQALGRPIDHYLPEDYAASALCSNVGNPIVAEAPLSNLATALKNMAKSLFTAESAAN